MKRTVILYSTDAGIRACVRNELESAQVEVVEIPSETDVKSAKLGRLDLPYKVDYIVTKSGLNSRIEGLAASLALKQGRSDVFAVVIPEAMDWLRDQLAKRGELVLVGGDQAK